MIREEIKKKLIEAMKAGEKDKVDTLRLINSTIKEKDIAGKYENIIADNEKE